LQITSEGRQAINGADDKLHLGLDRGSRQCRRLRAAKRGMQWGAFD
jgi:hypothetical protein